MGSDLYLAHRMEAEDNYAPTMNKLRDLLAVIHRDGGQYTGTHGLEKSVEDAMRMVPNLRLEKDCLRKQTRAYQRDLALARKILYFVKLRARDKMVRRVVERCLEELKQTS